MKACRNSETHEDLRNVEATELLSVEGGVVAEYDDAGNIIRDCTGRLVTIGGKKIWVPHGTEIFGSISR